MTLALHWAIQKPLVKSFFDNRTFSVQYVVSDPATRKCAIIDPVLDFDEKSGAIATRCADKILDYISSQSLSVEWILDTHPHADHFSAAQYLQSKTGAATAIGKEIVDIQKIWQDIYNFTSLDANGSQWDRLFAEGDRFMVGDIHATVMFCPGHTLASVVYLIGDAAFLNDTLLMPDFRHSAHRFSRRECETTLAIDSENYFPSRRDESLYRT